MENDHSTNHDIQENYESTIKSYNPPPQDVKPPQIPPPPPPPPPQQTNGSGDSG
jgi:hypothetical protein